MLNIVNSGVIAFIAVIMAVMTTTSDISAKDFKTPHRFSPGDIISSDSFNEIFEYFEASNQYLDMQSLIGTWECQKCVGKNHNGAILKSDLYETIDEDELWLGTQLQMDFLDDGDGTYSWSSFPSNGIWSPYDGDKCSGEGIVSLFMNRLIMEHRDCVTSVLNPIALKIIRKSKNQIEISQDGTVTYYPFLICDKISIAPNRPTSLRADYIDDNIQLSWTDASDNENGFRIYRKSSLSDEYEQVGTTGTDENLFTDSTATEGEFWYRIKAYNQFGESYGSGEIHVSLTN